MTKANDYCEIKYTKGKYNDEITLHLPDKSNVAVSRTYVLTYCALQKLCKVTQYTFVNIHECVTDIKEKFTSVQNVHTF